ncbi:MAG TPA: hypothetical protein V6C52_10670 [Coleofasciculaceae cyanobacterium]|jgi:hypothetical protein
MQGTVRENQFNKLHDIAKSFYQAYRLSGTIQMKFGLRTMPDSDGNSVVDVYLAPHDQESAATLVADSNACHMQFLENMVPASLLGYQFVLQITPLDTSQIDIALLETIEPVQSIRITGPGLVS